MFWVCLGIVIYLLIALGVGAKRSTLGRYHFYNWLYYPELIIKALLWFPIASWHLILEPLLEILSRENRYG